jgi:hypothetical protein
LDIVTITITMIIRMYKVTIITITITTHHDPPPDGPLGGQVVYLALKRDCQYWIQDQTKDPDDPEEEVSHPPHALIGY